MIFGGIVIALGGAILWGAARAGLGRLPGDIFIERAHFTIAIPLVTMIILSIVLTVVLNIAVRLWR
jgi:hypothetical protein